MKISKNNLFIFMIAFVIALAFTKLSATSDFKSMMYSAVYLFVLIPIGFVTIKSINRIFDVVVLKFNKG
ncbi:hypothetical protein HMPREF1210_01022 [Paenisporosarcina sp. HGH0030]|uniref:hypothetical protein n=1 Tax=Paenisporosarcina sp. HGH0030 TaxID=1078085 RepID=UPI00034EA181|nr:hypothetical protein [Paenisporosarcina sp. HGH0030]EPD53291.1 hypothetical protein HMPREF1210_01022 [Paenisporosarcina sp. HGH0030]